MQVPRKVIVMGVIAGSALLGLLLTLDARSTKPAPVEPVPVLSGEIIPEPSLPPAAQAPDSSASSAHHQNSAKGAVAPVQATPRASGVVDSVYRGQTVAHVPVADAAPPVTSASAAIAPPAGEGSIGLEDLIVCKDVERESRNPVDSGTSFSAKGGKVTCWVRIVNGQGKKIRHLWVLNGRTYAGVWLSIGSARWRTWGSKTITPGMVGPAEVSIEDDAGNKLGSASFTVTP